MNIHSRNMICAYESRRSLYILPAFSLREYPLDDLVFLSHYSKWEINNNILNQAKLKGGCDFIFLHLLKLSLKFMYKILPVSSDMQQVSFRHARDLSKVSVSLLA